MTEIIRMFNWRMSQFKINHSFIRRLRPLVNFTIDFNIK